MSYEGGWKALNLKFSDRVPRTEYSVQSYHWPLIQKVTGIDTSIEANREKATKEFVKSWDYAFMWMTPGGNRFKEEKDADKMIKQKKGNIINMDGGYTIW